MANFGDYNEKIQKKRFKQKMPKKKEEGGTGGFLPPSCQKSLKSARILIFRNMK